MSKRNRTPAPGARGRSAPVKINKPFPWGTVATSVVLGAALIGLLAYAFTNQGGGVRDFDEPFGPRLVKGGEDLARGHVAGTVDYPDYPERPPMGGDHSGTPQQCAVYTEPIPAENAVHSLEHGAVWVTYDPDLASADDVAALEELVAGGSYRMLSPYPGLGVPVSAQAWNHAIRLDDAGDPRLAGFLDLLSANPDTTPEPGATCENAAFLADPETA